MIATVMALFERFDLLESSFISLGEIYVFSVALKMSKETFTRFETKELNIQMIVNMKNWLVCEKFLYFTLDCNLVEYYDFIRNFARLTPL